MGPMSSDLYNEWNRTFDTSDIISLLISRWRLTFLLNGASNRLHVGHEDSGAILKTQNHIYTWPSGPDPGWAKTIFCSSGEGGRGTRSPNSTDDPDINPKANGLSRSTAQRSTAQQLCRQTKTKSCKIRTRKRDEDLIILFGGVNGTPCWDRTQVPWWSDATFEIL